MLNPANIPPLDTGALRGLFEGHIHRRPIDILFRGVEYTAARNDPSTQRKNSLAGFTNEITDLEIMLSLPAFTPPPVPNSADEIRVFDRIQPGVAGRTFKDYRITNVQSFTAPDCYQLTLSVRHP